jgi:hypothetical protein
MRVLGIEVVSGTVKVAGHRGQIPGAELAVVGPAHLDTGDLGQSIWTIGGLKGPREQIFFLDRLRAELGIDATGTEEEKPVDAGLIRGIDHIRLDQQVFPDEVGRIKIVGQDASNFGCRNKDVIRPLLLKEMLDSGTIGEIKLSMRSQQKPVETLAAQNAADRRAYQAIVSSNVDETIFPQNPGSYHDSW